MPQMSPMWWMCLTTMFIMTTILVMMIIYFNFNLNESKMKKFKLTQYNWKW